MKKVKQIQLKSLIAFKSLLSLPLRYTKKNDLIQFLEFN